MLLAGLKPSRIKRQVDVGDMPTKPSSEDRVESKERDGLC